MVWIDGASMDECDDERSECGCETALYSLCRSDYVITYIISLLFSYSL
jgi:hypothetical protein